MLDGSYNSLLVLFSLAVAILASYTTLVVAGRACTMGIGIWSMHFIGMLAFDLPIDVGYDLLITQLSLLFAVAASAFALWIVTQETLTRQLLAAGALVMGSGVAGMHYTGMASVRMMPGIVYDPTLLGFSVLRQQSGVHAHWLAMTVILATLPCRRSVRCPVTGPPHRMKGNWSDWPLQPEDAGGFLVSPVRPAVKS